MTLPLIPFPSVAKKSGEILSSSYLHISGGVEKPAQTALSTANDSNYPLYVLLLITIAG